MKGSSEQFEDAINADPEHREGSSVNETIDVASVDTRIEENEIPVSLRSGLSLQIFESAPARYLLVGEARQTGVATLR